MALCDSTPTMALVFYSHIALALYMHLLSSSKCRLPSIKAIIAQIGCYPMQLTRNPRQWLKLRSQFTASSTNELSKICQNETKSSKQLVTSNTNYKHFPHSLNSMALVSFLAILRRGTVRTCMPTRGDEARAAVQETGRNNVVIRFQKSRWMASKQGIRK